jgi:hypothetical protein
MARAEKGCRASDDDDDDMYGHCWAATVKRAVTQQPLLGNSF